MGKHPHNDLHAAARSGDLTSVVSILTSNPLAINSRDKHSRTPLHLAAWSGQAQVVIYLCQNKADVGAAAMDDMGAIHFAAQKGHLEVVRALVLAGVSVKSCNRKGFTPLHYAVQGSHLDVAKYLLRKGASLISKTKAGKTPLDLANSEEVRSFLLEYEKSSRKGEVMNTSKMAEQSDANLQSNLNLESSDKAEKLDPSIEEGDDSLKRKGGSKESSEEHKTKKAKVALNHLILQDDTQIENEDL